MKPPEVCIQEQERLIQELEKLRPYKKPKGIILKFPSWDDLNTFNLQRAAKTT